MDATSFRHGGGDAGPLVATVCIAGPALVALIPMAAAPALVAMAQHFGANAESQLFSQIVMTLPAAMLVLSAPVAGWLAGRIGQRAVLLASLVLFVIGGAGVLLIDSRAALVALRLLLGIAGGGVLTSCLGLIGDHFSGHKRERVLGYATSASSLLAGLALIYGGRLVDAGGWQAPFGLYLLGVPTLILAWLVIRDVRVPVPAASLTAADLTGAGLNAAALAAPASAPAPPRELGRQWPYYALLMLLTLGMFTPSVQVGFVLSAKGIGSAETIGTVIAATSFVAVVSAWAFGHMRRWLGLHGFLAIDALSMGSGIVLIGLADSITAIFAGCALVGIGAGMSEPATASLLFRRTSPAIHALAMGLIVSALNAGQFFNPVIFDPVRRMVGASGSFIALGAVLLAAAAFIAIRNPRDIFESNPHEQDMA